MRVRRFYREITVLLCALFAALITIWAHPPLSGDNLPFDLLLKSRAVFFAAPQHPSKVAVIAVDRRSLKSPALAKYPRLLLRPVYAHLIEEVFSANPAAFGFDMVFEDDLSRVPGLTSQIDTEFVAAATAHRDRIVLGSSKSVFPFPGLLDAVGRNNLASLSIPRDSDGITRRDVSGYWRNDGFTPTMYAALIARADPTIKLPRELLFTPRRHLETIPAYSLIDVLRCADDPVALAHAFKDKVVLLGVVSSIEDRIETSGRFLAPVDYGAPPFAACGLRGLGASNPASSTVPGVFLHAAAIDEVMNGDLTTTASPMLIAAIAATVAAVIAAIAMFVSPLLAIGIAMPLLVGIFGGATIALQHNFYLPVLLPILVACVTPLAAYAIRYLIEQRTLRGIENAFNHYLSPALVAKLAEDPGALTLGGERREITVMFADLSGFTSMLGHVEPEVLTSKINKYLGLVSEQVEATGGYVDKFIGDAVMALWGAPAADPEHASNAIRAALTALARVENMRVEDEARGEPAFSIKFGINSGPAVVGNVGTEKRYNYTAVGQTVNLASRLEGVPHLYHCHIVIGAETARLAGSKYLMRELDRIVAKGASAPMSIYEPLCELSKETPAQSLSVKRYADALRMFRERHFLEAARAWEELDKSECGVEADGNGHFGTPHSPASAMAISAHEMASNPPADTWDGARVLASK